MKAREHEVIVAGKASAVTVCVCEVATFSRSVGLYKCYAVNALDDMLISHAGLSKRDSSCGKFNSALDKLAVAG